MEAGPAALWILNAHCQCGEGLLLSMVLQKVLDPERGGDKWETLGVQVCLEEDCGRLAFGWSFVPDGEVDEWLS